MTLHIVKQCTMVRNNKTTQKNATIVAVHTRVVTTFVVQCMLTQSYNHMFVRVVCVCACGVCACRVCGVCMCGVCMCGVCVCVVCVTFVGKRKEGQQ